jgi:transcription initiation factor TFIID subunit 5
LLKRGFNRTEAVFRQESSKLGPDGRPMPSKMEDHGPKRFLKAFNLLKDWVDNNLDIYKVSFSRLAGYLPCLHSLQFELSKLLWPVFVYSWLQLIDQNYAEDAKILVRAVTPVFENVHADDLKAFSTITLPEHAKESALVKPYRDNKYRIPLNQYVAGNLFHFLEREAENGGTVIGYILQTYCLLDSAVRGPIEPFSFEAIYRRAQNMDLDEIDSQEGIPGVFTGRGNKDLLNGEPLTLGPLPMDGELREDVRAELEDEDQRNPPKDGKPSLVNEFDAKIKREDSADGPSRADLPLPPSRARDVVMEMQKVRENRDRFRIEGRTGGVGVPVSACMFTFHNTLGRYVVGVEEQGCPY